MNVISRCTYCDTPLTLRDEDGRVHKFMAHDLAFCRTAAYGNVRALKAALKMAHEQIAQLSYDYGKLVGEHGRRRDVTPKCDCGRVLLVSTTCPVCDNDE